jgi:uncharacterized protein
VGVMGPRYPLVAREVVPDVLRGFAIVAMLLAHASRLVPERPGAVSFLLGSLNDVASPLFALVMGMSAAIVLARPRPTARATWIVLAQNTVRGLILVVLGVWMAGWGSWIAIVLAPLGFTLIVGTPLALLKSRWIAVIGAALLVVGAPIVSAVTIAAAPTMALTDPVTRLLIESFFSNPYYRVFSLLPFFLAGVLLLRHGFRRDRLLWALLVVALVSYAVRPLWLRFAADPNYFPGSYPDTLHDIGLVLLVYVAVVVLASLRGRPAASVVGGVFLPLRIVGTLALSIYVLQVAVVAWIANAQPPGMGVTNLPLLAAIVVLGVPALGALWWYFLGQGPIERLIGFVTGSRTLLGRPRAPAAPPGARVSGG